MSYYHIKNIKIDKKNNCISADLADSCWSPLDWMHINDLSDEKTFEEKYADFIYNLVSGNFHPISNNKYSKIVMSRYLNNYYNDAHDIGKLATYNKYKDVVMAIMNNNYSNCVELKSERELNPERYYVLNKIDINSKYDGEYYTNEKGDLFNYNDNKLSICSTRENSYGYPMCISEDIDKFKKFNDFLNIKYENDLGVEI